MNDTKLIGDISETIVRLELMRRGFDVLEPVGDRLPFDLVAHSDGQFIRLQIKTAYLDGGHWTGKTRRCRTNRKSSKITPVDTDSCDFFIYVVQDENACYIFPSEFVKDFKSRIGLDSRPECRNNWDILR